MELYLQQNAIKVDAVAKEKEAGQKQKENRQALKVRFHDRVLSSFLVTKIAKKNISKKRLDIDIGKQGFTKS